MTKQQVITALRKCAKELGVAPTFGQFCKMTKQPRHSLLKHFYTFTYALRAARLKPTGSGHVLRTKPLFTAWARLTRKLGRVPTITEWKMQGRYSERPMVTRFKYWSRVPEGMKLFAKDNGLENDWQDVMAIIEAHLAQKGKPQRKMDIKEFRMVAVRPKKELPIFGAPLFPFAMTCAPTNEAGVIFLFGALWRELGFVANKVQSAFPDWEGLRRLTEEQWQRIRIEFEYESRNFVVHGHDIKNCDLIVCWKHNWPECPVEVIELSKIVGRLLGREL